MVLLLRDDFYTFARIEGRKIYLPLKIMGAGQILSVEELLVVEGEGQCSMHMEPSSTQEQLALKEQK